MKAYKARKAEAAPTFKKKLFAKKTSSNDDWKKKSYGSKKEALNALIEKRVKEQIMAMTPKKRKKEEAEEAQVLAEAEALDLLSTDTDEND